MNNEYFAYIRVSTTKQGEGASLEAQTEVISQYAANHGLSISRWFEEKETASKQGRKQFNQMIKLLNSGKAAGVIIHKIDRSARNMRDWATVIDLHDAGTDVRFAADSIDLNTRSGRLMAGMLAVMAEDYSRNLNEEREKGFNGRLKQKLYPLKAPTGYLDNGGGKPKTICLVQGPKVVELFELYATGAYSLEALSVEMWNRGLRSSRGGRLHRSKIDRILRNPFYIGMIKIWSTGYLGPGIHEPLISSDLFQRVQDRRDGKTNRKITKHNFVYRGKINCQSCGHNLIGERQRGRVYYRCHQRDCSTKTIREDQIEEVLRSALGGLKLSPEAVVKLEGRLTHSPARTEKPACNTVAAIAELNQQKERLLNAYVTGKLSEEAYNKRFEELQVQETRLTETSNDNGDFARKQECALKILEHLKSFVSTYFLANASEKRQFLEIVFSNITLEDRMPLFTTQNWLLKASLRGFVPYCGQEGATHRRRRDLIDHEIDGVLDALDCLEARTFLQLCEQVSERSVSEGLTGPASDTVYRDAA